MRWTKSTAQILHTFYLVVTGTSFFFNDFPFSWEFHHPNWRIPSFFRGVGLNHQPANDLIRVTSLPVLRVRQKTLRMLMMFTLRNTDTVYFFRSIPSPVITLWWDIPIGSSHIGGTIYRAKRPYISWHKPWFPVRSFPSENAIRRAAWALAEWARGNSRCCACHSPHKVVGSSCAQGPRMWWRWWLAKTKKSGCGRWEQTWRWHIPSPYLGLMVSSSNRSVPEMAIHRGMFHGIWGINQQPWG